MCCIMDQIHPSKIFINNAVQPERTANPSESEITIGHKSTVVPESTVDLPEHEDPEYTVENSTDPSITEIFHQTLLGGDQQPVAIAVL